jgi:hypothetical protein
VIATHLSEVAGVSMERGNAIEETAMMQLVINLLRPNHNAKLAITRWTITPDLLDMFDDDDDFCIDVDESDVMRAAAAA